MRKVHELNNISWNNTKQLKPILKEKKLIKKSMNEYFNIKPKFKQTQKFPF